MKRNITLIALLLATVSISACGGGGGRSDTTSSPLPTETPDTATPVVEEPKDDPYPLPVPLTVTFSYSGKNWNSYKEGMIANVGSEVVSNSDVWSSCPSAWEDGDYPCMWNGNSGSGSLSGLYWVNIENNSSIIDSIEATADTSYPPYIEYRSYDIQYSIIEVPSTLKSAQVSKRIGTSTYWSGPMDYMTWKLEAHDQLDAFPENYDIQIITRLLIKAEKPFYNDNGFLAYDTVTVVDKVFEGDLEYNLEELDPTFWDTETGTDVHMNMYTEHILTLTIQR